MKLSSTEIKRIHEICAALEYIRIISQFLNHSTIYSLLSTEYHSYKSKILLGLKHSEINISQYEVNISDRPILGVAF